ncbi:nucleopolyhedrovirus p10 family protein [Gigaspora margarita]|uniref:Nucleopolyhedrovirus p10 family protein n=1 Tax=Gigaspora margarita TaxID=4874 RepID=A0A8H4ATJ8_GIGMA|nr:nucleopolyhedrovirus p10 family protein [Gigaspora margarita]
MTDKGEFSQTPKSKSEEKIDIVPEQTKPHNGKKITKLMLSPDSKCVATWSRDDRSICVWELDDDQLVKQSTEQSVGQSENELNQFKLFVSRNIEEFCHKFCPELSAVSKLHAVSNNKLVAISDTIVATIQSKYVQRKKIEVINLVENKKVELNLYQYRDWSIEECRFYADKDNNEFFFIVAHDHECQYIFKFLCNKSQSCKINNSISCGAFKDIKKCHIDGEKIMLIDNCSSLTQWNLSTLLLENQYQLGWETHSAYESLFFFNKTFTLLAVYQYYYPKGFIYVFFTENALLLSKCDFEAELQHLEFISSDKEERLLLFFDNDNFEIRDPYDLEQVIQKKTISKLCEELFDKKPSKKEEFITMIDKKIYYTSDENLWVQEVSEKQWIKYLREILKDYNKTKVLPSKPQIEEILERFIKEVNMTIIKEDNMTILLSYDGSLVKWEVNSGEKIIKAFLKSGSDINDWNFVDNIKLKDEFYEKRDEIWGGIRIDFYVCNLLPNEDLAMITSAGLFIWSIWPKYEEKKIRLRYYISYKHEYMEKLDFKHLLTMIQIYEKKNSLPAPDFEFLIVNSKEKHTEDGRCLFAELLDDYIEDKILMKSYGQDLLMCFLKSKNYSLVGRLCSKIYEETENHNMSEKIQLLDVFTLLFTELTQFPQLLKNFLSYTLFIYSTNVPEEVKFSKFFSEPHLQSHINYLQPYFTNNIKEDIKWFFYFIREKSPISFSYEDLQTKLEKMFYKDFQTIVLIFPLPKFSSYGSDYIYWKELISPKFSTFSNYEFPEFYKYWYGEALLNFKWNTYGKYYFFAIFIFYFVFMLCFLMAATIKELSNETRDFLLTATIFLGLLHLMFEIRQCIYSPLLWITDIWNYFDIGAILFPILTSIDWLQSNTTPTWAITLSVLLLELKFITLFRFIMFVFAHSLHILLRPKTDISNNPNNSEELSTNMFTHLDSAYLAVYIMLTGDTSSVSNWSLTENPTLTLLMVLFSFFTTIYLMNLFIGLLSNFISETNKKELFLLQRAKMLSEIELLYMLPHQRRKNNWFPEIIFYRFSLDKFYEIAYKVNNNKWDDVVEIPSLPNPLLKIVNLHKEEDKKEDKDELFQKLESIKKGLIQKFSDEEKKKFQKLDDEKITNELKKLVKKVN